MLDYIWSVADNQTLGALNQPPALWPHQVITRAPQGPAETRVEPQAAPWRRSSRLEHGCRRAKGQNGKRTHYAVRNQQLGRTQTKPLGSLGFGEPLKASPKRRSAGSAVSLESFRRGNVRTGPSGIGHQEGNHHVNPHFCGVRAIASHVLGYSYS